MFVNDSLSPQSHISKVTVYTANQRVNLLMRAFVSRDQSTLVRAYCTHVRPIHEYNSVIWSPSNLRDIRRVQSVQRRFTKRILGLRTG